MSCEICQNWCRSFSAYKLRRDGIPLVTNHHENCMHYNDSLMDVWKVSVGCISCYVANEQDAKDTAGEDESGEVVIEKQKMHQEIFENLPEFDGF